jgi:hypothetical protein
MKPEEYDIVRLLRPLPEHHLAAGAKGTVVMDYSKHSDSDTAPFEVEFTDAEGVTIALVTLQASDLEVVKR